MWPEGALPLPAQPLLCRSPVSSEVSEEGQQSRGSREDGRPGRDRLTLLRLGDLGGKVGESLREFRENGGEEERREEDGGTAGGVCCLGESGERRGEVWREERGRDRG